VLHVSVDRDCATVALSSLPPTTLCFFSYAQTLHNLLIDPIICHDERERTIFLQFVRAVHRDLCFLLATLDAGVPIWILALPFTGALPSGLRRSQHRKSVFVDLPSLLSLTRTNIISAERNGNGSGNSYSTT
jgi:hypothetical protein